MSVTECQGGLMKKIITVFFTCIVLLQAKDNSFKFDPTKSYLWGSLECVIGDSLKLIDRSLNIHIKKDPNIRIGLFSNSNKFIVELKRDTDYSYTLEKDPVYRDQRLVNIKLNYYWNVQYSDSIYNLVIRINKSDRDNFPIEFTDYWPIKPKYPTLTPLIDSVYYYSEQATFNFAALGLDNTSRYSYEVIGGNDTIRGEGSTISLDNLTNDMSLLNKELTIRGLYNGSVFKYSDNGNIKPSEWPIKILPPGEDVLAIRTDWEKMGSSNTPTTNLRTKILNPASLQIFKFCYQVNTRKGNQYLLVLPEIRNLSVSGSEGFIKKSPAVYPEPPFWTTVVIEPSSNYAANIKGVQPVDITISFTDQFGRNINRKFRAYVSN
jgi:hypothetical protein